MGEHEWGMGRGGGRCYVVALGWVSMGLVGGVWGVVGN